jgi:hypothetical protein
LQVGSLFNLKALGGDGDLNDAEKKRVARKEQERRKEIAK